MRTLRFNQYEFDHPNSEESLEVWVAPRGECGHLGAFLVDCGELRLSNPERATDSIILRLDDLNRSEMVIDYLKNYCHLDLEEPALYPVLVLLDDWNDLKLAMELPEQFILFHWETSA